MANNPLSNTSYTNKDFNAIYVELLDLVKKLTYKWDPSISNESDPGVILLKLNAIIGDKNNYNIDKNILENFPETVTQDFSARSLYRQLAYHMPWYISATTDLSFKWLGEGADAINTLEFGPVKIDKFTMFTDAKTENVYTILRDVEFRNDNIEESVPAIEGIINDLTINGSNIIELVNIDEYNRIYFNDINVAENGLFIYSNPSYANTSSSAIGDEWIKVDNVYLEESGTKCYEFGVDSRKNLCYIEFPNDIESLIGNGILIKYITSNGIAGNIGVREIDRFYQDYATEVNGESKVLTSELVAVANYSSTTNGKDPEDFEDAFINYKRTAGTFDTLVTLRDYMNAIFNSGLASNVIVCDRYNDIQSSYKIVTQESFGDSEKTHQVHLPSGESASFLSVYSTWGDAAPKFIHNYFYTKEEDDKGIISFTPLTEAGFNAALTNEHIGSKKIFYKDPKSRNQLDAFDLRMYVMHQPGVLGNINDYNSTFTLEPSSSVAKNNILDYISDTRCIQHNFADIEPDVPCIFKNYFQLNLKIIPYQKLDATAENNLKSNIRNTLISAINSNKLTFGEEADYDYIYDSILNSDERIKSLILDDFKYTTFATYWDASNKMFKEVPISKFNTTNVVSFDWQGEFDSADEVDNLLICNNITNEYKDKLKDYLFENTYFVVKVGIKNAGTTNYVYKVVNGEMSLYSDKLDAFRKTIICKSILAGNTPLFIQDTDFQYTIDQQQEHYSTTDRLTTNLEICPFGTKEVNSERQPIELTKDSAYSAKYTLQDNENVRFFGPSMTTKKTFANYIKFVMYLNKKATTREVCLSFNEYTSTLHSKDTPVRVFVPESQSYITYVDYNYDFGQDCYVNVYDKLNQLEHENIKFSKLPLNIQNQFSTSEPMGDTNSDYKVKARLTLGMLDKVYLSEKKLYDHWSDRNVSVYIEEDLKYISPGSDYRLGKDEYIIFFYKTEDGDNSPYKFEKFGEGQIICPNFMCYSSSIDMRNLITVPNSDTGEISYSEDPTSVYQRVYKLYGKNDLSGTRKIELKDVVEINLSEHDGYSYYFITNNIKQKDGKDYYVLAPFSLNVGGENKYAYILDSDEYFFHINRKKTSFEMLGPGSMVIFDSGARQKPDKIDVLMDDPYFTCSKVDYLKIASEGLSSFMSELISISKDVTLREQRILNFSKGDTLTFNLLDSVGLGEIKSIKLTTGEFTKVDKYQVNYMINGEEGTLSSIELGDASYNWLATCCLNIDCSYDVPQVIHSNDVFSRRFIEIGNARQEVDSIIRYSRLFDGYGCPDYSTNNLVYGVYKKNGEGKYTEEIEGAYTENNSTHIVSFNASGSPYVKLNKENINVPYERYHFFKDAMGKNEYSESEFDANKQLTSPNDVYVTRQDHKMAYIEKEVQAGDNLYLDYDYRDEPVFIQENKIEDSNVSGYTYDNYQDNTFLNIPTDEDLNLSSSVDFETLPLGESVNLSITTVRDLNEDTEKVCSYINGVRNQLDIDYLTGCSVEISTVESPYHYDTELKIHPEVMGGISIVDKFGKVLSHTNIDDDGYYVYVIHRNTGFKLQWYPYCCSVDGEYYYVYKENKDGNITEYICSTIDKLFGLRGKPTKYLQIVDGGIFNGSNAGDKCSDVIPTTSMNQYVYDYYVKLTSSSVDTPTYYKYTLTNENPKDEKWEWIGSTDDPMENINVYKQIPRWRTWYTLLSIDNPLYMLSSVTLNKIGGKNIDITYIDTNQEITKPQIYLFKLDSNFKEPYFNKLTNGSINIMLSKFQGTKDKISLANNITLNNNTDKVYYLILPIRVNSTDHSYSLMDVASGEEVPNLGKSKDKVSETRDEPIYYYLIEMEANSSKELNISWDKKGDYKDEDIITVYPMIRCSKNESFNAPYGISWKNLQDEITKLDENNLFNYSRIVNSNEKIEDPLNPLEFFDPYHFCNKFTIAKGDLYFSDLNGSNIKLVNNR